MARSSCPLRTNSPEVASVAHTLPEIGALNAAVVRALSRRSSARPLKRRRYVVVIVAQIGAVARRLELDPKRVEPLARRHRLVLRDLPSAARPFIGLVGLEAALVQRVAALKSGNRLCLANRRGGQGSLSLFDAQRVLLHPAEPVCLGLGSRVAARPFQVVQPAL